LSVGSHTITCTVTRGNGLSASLSRTFTIKSAGKTPSEIVTENNLPNIGGGYRYTGANPNNYVSFNGKLFRIIGVFNGQLKIMQNDFYSTSKAWDTSKSNNWARPATLNTELNSTYWNTIDSTYQAMVDQSHSWGIGGRANSSSSNSRSEFYSAENNTKWTGKVALMAIADYGYASTSCTDSTNMYTSADCRNNNWIFNSSNDQWTITPLSGPYNVWIVRADGFVPWYNANYTTVVRPVVYLKSSIKITGGTGTSSDPYQLSL
ncbi:MAG: hypothetical protein HFH31_04270, partial [Bacilli bacterium]|nr:hypothetical protein [Bacilli bacterium]